MDSFSITLEFTLDLDAPPEYRNRWDIFKNICRSGRPNNIEITQEWLNDCTLQSNQNLPLLDRCEGGIGGDSNIEDKQIRFYNSIDYNCPWIDTNKIIFRVENSDNKKAQWSLEELKDLTNAFVKVCDDHMYGYSCRGSIVLIDKDTNFRQ